MAVRIGDPATGGGVLFTQEQGAETVRTYARRPVRLMLDGRDKPEPSSRDQALSMFASGASLEDIARAGGKTYETTDHPRMVYKPEYPHMLDGMFGPEFAIIGGVVGAAVGYGIARLVGASTAVKVGSAVAGASALVFMHLWDSPTRKPWSAR